MPELFSEVSADGRGGGFGLYARRAIMTVFALISAAGLWGVFGQRESESKAASPAVRVRLSAPETVRGGLFFQARIEIRALAKVEYPRLVLDEAWLEGLQVNSIEPSPDSESSRDGRLVLSYGGLEPGDRLLIWLQFEANPTNVGRRSLGLEVDDATRRLVRIPRTLTVLP